MVLAYSVDDALEMTNAIAGDHFPECRDNVDARHVTEWGPAEPGFARFAWDGEVS